MVATEKIRKLSRLSMEMHLSGTMAVLDLTDGDYDLGIVALLVLARCTADWIEGDRLRAPAHPSRAISIRAIAGSLGSPYTTVYRHVGVLKARGLLVVGDHGCAISHAPDVAPRVLALIAAAHDSLIRMVEDFAPDVALPPPAAVADRHLFATSVAVAFDIWLVPFEYARPFAHDWTSALIYMVIVVANVRHVTVDPVLGERFASEPTPDALRAPIGTRQIARLARLSYGTTFRHCKALQANDIIDHARGGWLLPGRRLGDRDVDTGVQTLHLYYLKRIAELTSLGFDAANPARHYLAGRPAYAPLDGVPLSCSGEL